jgi:DNA modification methylase
LGVNKIFIQIGDQKMSNNKLKKLYKKLTNEEVPCEVIGKALLCNHDCIQVLKILPSNSIDSCITDGPYGIGIMGKEWDNFKPKAIRNGIQRKGGTGVSPCMFSGKYDLSRKGGVRFQQFCYEWAKEVYRVLKPGAMLLSCCSTRMYHRMATGIEGAGFEVRDQLQWLFGSSLHMSYNISIGIDKYYGAERTIVCENPNRKGRKNWDDNPKNITLPSTEQAKKWHGWGTTLKHSNEPILLARKPIETSVVRNVLKYGTGGLNVDACRVGEQKRFPSNTLINEEVAEMLGDKSRFYYCPKVSKEERNAGCEHLEAKPQNSDGNGRTYNDRCAVCGKKFIGSEKTRCQCPVGVKKTDKTVYRNKNHHPTVKPIALMEYLVKLVTPKNGICLDIFAGSGSTGIASVNQNFDFLGIEIEPEYYEIATARISHWQNINKVA